MECPSEYARGIAWRRLTCQGYFQLGHPRRCHARLYRPALCARRACRGISGGGRRKAAFGGGDGGRDGGRDGEREHVAGS